MIANESRATETKRMRLTKGPRMKNRWENRSTKKARIYQFTQRTYKQNKKATINKIINSNFSLNHAEQVFPERATRERTIHVMENLLVMRSD